MNSLLLCPVCGAALERDEKVYRCTSRHSFDLARSGYVNLLCGVAGGTHGDNRDMMAARRRFLDSGAYTPLCRVLAEEAARLLPDGGTLADAGCGEGYYTAALGEATGGAVYGFDISKDALALAARRLPRAIFAVASVYALPFASGAADLVSCIFAPLAAEEYHRILRGDGVLLMVIPGVRHLFEMKSILYDTPYPNQLSPYELPGFTLLSKVPVDFTVRLETAQQIDDLFRMTPYYYRTPEPGRARLAALTTLCVQASFEVLTYRRLP